jgi:hypothetical protein
VGPARPRVDFHVNVVNLHRLLTAFVIEITTGRVHLLASTRT